MLLPGRPSVIWELQREMGQKRRVLFAKRREHMNTALFWDDQRIFCRKGLKRIYGEPEFLPDSVYYDPQNSASGGMPSIVQNPKGDYTLFYQAFTPEHKTYAFAATSPDGIHWIPRDTAKEHLTNPDFPNQLLPTDNAELCL